MGKEQVNIYVIAEEAGVSPATVSRVLTGNAKVSDVKRKKVEELIKKYDYRPNAIARNLSNTKSNVIGVLVADIRNPFYANMAISCEVAANQHGYMLMLCNSLDNNETGRYHLQKMFEQRVDAVVLIGGKVDELVSDEEYVEYMNQVADHTPVVITGKLEGTDCFQVNLDEGQAMETLIDYLIDSGHKEIAMIGGSREFKSTYDKRVRYKSILRRHGITSRDEYLLETRGYSVDDGYRGMNEFFDRKVPLPTAVIAINDFTAVGIMRSIREHGLCIPEDISVASFDNTYIAEACIPRLTSVGYDYEKFGRTLIETVLKAIEGEEPPRVQLISSSLEIRESVKILK